MPSRMVTPQYSQAGKATPNAAAGSAGCVSTPAMIAGHCPGGGVVSPPPVSRMVDHPAGHQHQQLRR